MKPVLINLIPLKRREARARRVWIKRWVGLAGGYGVLLLVFSAACVLWTPTAPEIQRQLLEARAEQARVEDQIRRLSVPVEKKTEFLGTAMQVYSRPDWSVLLAIVAGELQDQLLLRRCRLWPDERSEVSGTPPASEDQAVVLVEAYRARRFRLELSGVARSQQAVSQYLLRLEQARLFDSVALVNTHPTQFLSQEATGFEIVCTLSPDGASK